MRNVKRFCLIALWTLAGPSLHAQSTIPTDWIDPDTGHRVIRGLSESIQVSVCC